MKNYIQKLLISGLFLAMATSTLGVSRVDGYSNALRQSVNTSVESAKSGLQSMKNMVAEQMFVENTASGVAGFVGLPTYIPAVWISVFMALNLAYGDTVDDSCVELDPDQYADIYDTVKDLSVTMQIPMPKLFLMNTSAKYASGFQYTAKQGVVAVGKGLIQALDKNELRGVLAHELSHIKNRDALMRLASYTASCLSTFFIGKGLRSLSDYNDNTLCSLAVVGITLPAASAAVTAFYCKVLRSQEFMADKTGVIYSKDPITLVRALKKIAGSSYGRKADIFSIHPASSDRVHELEKMNDNKSVS